jgi:hypothetical protein
VLPEPVEPLLDFPAVDGVVVEEEGVLLEGLEPAPDSVLFGAVVGAVPVLGTLDFSPGAIVGAEPSFPAHPVINPNAMAALTNIR